MERTPADLEKEIEYLEGVLIDADVPVHHCPACDRLRDEKDMVINPAGQRFCSLECEDKYEIEVQKGVEDEKELHKCCDQERHNDLIATLRDIVK